jgi:hypothetical protein
MSSAAKFFFQRRLSNQLGLSYLPAAAKITVKIIGYSKSDSYLSIHRLTDF